MIFTARAILARSWES